MKLIFQQFLELDLATQIFLVAEHVLFLLYLVAVLYLLFFSLCSIFKIGAKYPKAKKKYRYLVLFISNGENQVSESVRAFVEQDYPKENYDIIVVSNNESDAMNANLALLPVTLHKTAFDSYYKTYTLQHAMKMLGDKSYDVVVVMEGSNTVDKDFLDKINNAYYSGGMAIQTHRVAKSCDTDTAVLDAVSEEINNSIFRRGHVNVGLSSGLIGSGMVFNFDWFRENIMNVTPVGLDKQLETRLIEQAIFIEYLNDVYVYGDKVANTSDFGDQRRLWARNSRDNLKLAIRKLPSALFHRNYDYCDKLFQWVMPSRILLIGTLVVVSVIMTVVSWNLSLKWWAILLLLIVAFSIAIPDSLVDARFVKAIRTMPKIFILMVANKFKRKKS